MISDQDSDLQDESEQHALELEEEQNESNIDTNTTTPPKSAAPWWTLIVLAIAVLFMSSAATVLKYMDDVTPILRASWRLQV